MKTQFDSLNKVIYQFVKNDKGNLIGCVAAVGPNKVGWSKCNTKKGDVFDKKRALQIAVGRAQTHVYLVSEVHRDIQSVYRHFLVDRRVSYFKDSNALI